MGLSGRDDRRRLKAWGPVGFGSPADIDSLTWPAFFLSLIPLTIGNIIGGGVLVGAVYWFIYLRHSSRIE